ncbi:membrane protein [Planobispora takensis]|uniref:Membrane protein n=2 Tax=Planobispora takensis TaxID=1367882 RepID=A0A8J3WTC2_9ACTN|nr:membrane protein [Planobispora takensis]
MNMAQMEGAAHRAANSRTLDRLARLGMACRGILYGLIGFLALQIAFFGGSGGKEADKTGALEIVREQSFGTVLLWLMVVGFVALTLWQLSEALIGRGRTKDRLESAGRTAVYALIVATLLSLLLRGDAGGSTDEQSKDLTAKLMDLPAGQFLVGLIGLGLIALGAYWAHKGWKKRFLKDLRTGEMPAKARELAEKLGMAGYLARGVIAVAAGIFVIQAAVTYDPDQAKGIDSTLRSLAETPVGPWLLGIVAIGLLLFAVYCFFEARWHRV